MNGVIGMASLLLDTDLTAEQRDTAETIQASAEALLSLVNDLLDFEDRQPQHDPRSADFNPRVVVDEVVDLLAEQAWSHGLDLTAEIDDAVPARAHADPSRLMADPGEPRGQRHRSPNTATSRSESATSAGMARRCCGSTSRTTASAFPRRPRRASSRRSPR